MFNKNQSLQKIASPSLKKQPSGSRIRNVWRHNFKEEFLYMMSLVDKTKYVGMVFY